MAGLERGRPDFLRLSSEHTAVVVLRPPEGTDVTAAGQELRAALLQLYGGLGDVEVATWALARSIVAVVSVGGAAPAASAGEVVASHPAGFVWGLPVAAGGEPDDAAVRDALAQPSQTGEWLGAFVLAGLENERVRLVTSCDLRPTLRVAQGPAGTAAATRSLAAAVAAGLQPRIDRARIAELVAFGAVLGEDELVADVRRLPEASVVDLEVSGVTVTALGSRGDRLAAGPAASTPQQLRQALGDVVEAFAAVPNLHLAMTGGRDSLLIASCAADRGLALPTFTFGPSRDATEAAAVAAALGWTHREIGFGEGERRLDEVIRLSSWTEGAVTGWDLAGPGPVWPVEGGATWLAGLGGETGRAFYWDDPEMPRIPAGYLTGRAAADLPPPVQHHLTTRLQQVLGRLSEQTGRTGPELLDVFYALGRVRGWMARQRPMAFLRSTSAAYTSPAVLTVLLDLPRSARLDGSAFDQALAMGPPVRDWARQAATTSPSRTPSQSRFHRAARFLMRSRRQPPDPGGETLVAFAHDLAERSIVRATLGDDWWHRMLDNAPYDATARLQGWQGLAIDALDHQLTKLELPRRD